MDAQRLTPSMRIALSDLKLDRLAVLAAVVAVLCNRTLGRIGKLSYAFALFCRWNLSMPAFLFLQRFENGRPATLPFAPVMDFLACYGTAGRGRGDVELTPEPGDMAAACTIVGSPEAGVGCIGFERPYFDHKLRQVAWECMARFGCAIFDDSLNTVYAPLDGVAALPADLLAASVNGVRQVSSLQQLWPEEVEIAVEGPPTPGLRYTNPNANGTHFQLFDYAEFEKRLLHVELAIRPEACNPGTLRVLRNLELRVDAALRANPGHGVIYHYADNEASLRLLESPRLDEIAHRGVTIAVPPPGMATQPVPFIADRGVYFSALDQCRELAAHVRGKYQLELDGGPASLDLLAGILDKLHLFYRQERAKHAGAAPYVSALAATWAHKAGFYLGDVIRRSIGGQWGYVPRGRHRLLALRTHAGRNRLPHLRVLDHIVNGPRDSIADWFRQLATSDASVCPRQEDLARDIPLLAHILLGHHRFEAGGLPLEPAIPREGLDFSVGSLRLLDAYLRQVADQARSLALSEQTFANLVLAAGAYFGEVIRGAAAAPNAWQWTTYDDFARTDPGFAERRPRELGFSAFLDSEENTFYPLQQVASLAAGVQVASTYDQAIALGCPAPPPPRPEAEILRPAAVNAWPADAAMAAMLRQTREELAHWRQMATKRDILNLRGIDPGWMGKGPLAEVVAGQELLLAQGSVVWGALVQANNNLFQPGPEDHPACLAYSTDPHFDARPQALKRIAGELFAYKSGGAPAALKRIADMLADEYECAFDLPVPEIVTDRQVAISAFLVYRRHLPGGVLLGGWFPLLTHPETRARMIVPRQFWPLELTGWWQAGKLRL